ncbi:MAG: HAD-IA family hydrolase, partial [Desulfuromonadales bacterium]|nr:HAD-IA family hydrolase [Desulfuromonadales bacterium]
KVYDIRVAAYQPKPYPEPYHAVLAELGTTPGRCIMIEDSRDNLHTAKKLGMGTILVGDGHTPDFVDVHLDNARQVHAGLRFWEKAS